MNQLLNPFFVKRKERNLKQKDVAAAIGATRAAVAKWESGKITPSPKVLIRIADFYGCTVDELIRYPAAQPDTA